MTDIFHQPPKGPPRRSGWENQKETSNNYRKNWNRIFNQETKNVSRMQRKKRSLSASRN